MTYGDWNSVELVCPIGTGRGCFLLVKGRGGSRGVSITEEVVPMGTAAQAQAGRDRARESRLKAARERRLRLDPDQLAREQRIVEGGHGRGDCDRGRDRTAPRG